ncbi:MAG: LAGLIDADG family homing endonuclease [Candidatus Omnitrophota bacterium]
MKKDFFVKWTPGMAYVLGYFCADGSMFINPRGSKYISFYSVDQELLTKVKHIMNSPNRIGEKTTANKNWKKLYSLQIGSKKIYSDMLKLGLTPTKAKRMTLPNIPNEFLHHFIRGYFDGDGCITYGTYKKKDRSTNSFCVMVRFASSSKDFLQNVLKQLSLAAKLSGGSISRNGDSYHLVYSKNDSGKLFDFMYNNVSRNYYLERKYNKFKSAFEISGAVA